MIDTRPLLFRSTTDFPPVQRGNLEILQVNLGYRCNLSCTHCHVNAGPKRTEEMSWHTAQQVLEVVQLRDGAQKLHGHAARHLLGQRPMPLEPVEEVTAREVGQHHHHLVLAR